MIGFKDVQLFSVTAPIKVETKAEEPQNQQLRVQNFHRHCFASVLCICYGLKEKNENSPSRSVPGDSQDL